MKDKGHFYISLFKSVLRIFGCIYAIATGDIFMFIVPMCASEFLGIVEEFVDKR